MSINQKRIRAAERLYEYREKAVFIRGVNGFCEDVEKWKPVFNAEMERSGSSEIEALVTLLNIAREKPDAGILMHILSAVCCELVEPEYTVDAAGEQGC